MVIGVGVIYVGATLCSGPPDLFAFGGVLTFVVGMVGWCPVYEWLGISSTHNGLGAVEASERAVVRMNDRAIRRSPLIARPSRHVSIAMPTHVAGR
jgi:hypothetical protein